MDDGSKPIFASTLTAGFRCISSEFITMGISTIQNLSMNGGSFSVSCRLRSASSCNGGNFSRAS